MKILAGGYEASLDKKRRFKFPKNLLDLVEGLALYSMFNNRWIEIFQEETYRSNLKEEGITDMEITKEERLEYFKRTYLVSSDKQGRAVLPKGLIKEAGIKPPCRLEIIGNLDRILLRQKHENSPARI